MKKYTIQDNCVGCGLCKKRCPVKAISGNIKEKHSIDENLCINCGLCGRLCNFGAVYNTKGAKAEKEDKTQWKKPFFHKICSGCSLCIETCPVNCIQLTKPRFKGDTQTKAVLKSYDDCIGCGLCEKVCPIGAIEMTEPNTAPEPIKTKGGNGMYKAYCRVYQGIMKVGNYVLPYRMPEFIEGAGSVKKLPKWIKEKGIDNVLVVTDNGLVKLGLSDEMLKAMDEENIKYTVFSDVQPNPTSDDVEKGYKIFKKNKCNGIVAFGGGAPMDCAKAIGARAARPNKSVSQLQGLLKVLKKIPPLVAVPTTSGTGSETTVAAVITDSKTSHKASINDTVLIPKYAVLDPVLTIGLPPSVTATTGMDALCHAVEAYTNGTYNTKLENDLAKRAVKLIYENLLTAYKDGKNIKARHHMQKAAFFAGRAFTRGCVGYVHAVGHTLGGLYHVPHGLAMSVILPKVLRQFGESVYKPLSELADECGIKGASEKEKALKFIEWIEYMQKEMNIPSGFDVIKPEDIPQIISWAMKEANPLYPVPVIWGKKEFRELIESLMI